MITIRTKTLFLCACFLETLWLLAAQMLNVTAMLLPCLICFLALVGWAAIKNVAMPVMLFFLPFAPLLKFRPGTISFFTIALLLIYGIYTVTGSRQVRIVHLIPALLLVVLTLITKTAYGYEFDNTYILFIITLVLVPFLARELDGGYDFYWLTVCFALGICLAAITARYLMVLPTISRYVNVEEALGMIRRSGYTGDPNFYSAHITAALSGLLVVLLSGNKRNKMFWPIALACMLLYCGLMSVSKSFSLISVCLLLLWFVALLFQRGRLSVKVTMMVVLIVAGVFLLSSTVFTDMLDAIVSRFSSDSNLSDLTTGRTDLWAYYIRAMFEDGRLLLFGQGFTDVIFGEKATHNTILQCVFQLGLVGSALLVMWIVYYVKALLDGARIRYRQIVSLAILLIGIIGPSMALDYLFFDEFFLLPIYMCMAVRFLHRQQEEDYLLD